MSYIKEMLKKYKRIIYAKKYNNELIQLKKDYIGDENLPTNGPLVSIIMTVYNREKFIETAVKSVLNQGYSNIELIVVNDGSTDESESKIKELQKADSRIKYFYKENSGQLDTFKYAYEKANGEYVTRLDSDDIMDEDMISLCMYEVLKNEKLNFVYFDLYDIDSQDRFWFKSSMRTFTEGDDVLKEIFKNFHSVIPDVAFWKKEYMKNIKKFYIEENIPFYIDTINSVEFKHIPLPLYYYRHHNNNYASNLTNLKFVLGGITKTIEYIICNYDFKCYLNIEQLNDPYYHIAKRYYEEALKYQDGVFGSYKFEKSDKIYEVFLEKTKYWLEKSDDSERKNKLHEDMKAMI